VTSAAACVYRWGVRRHAAVCLGFALAALAPRSARADEAAVCVAASDRGQVSRDEGRFRAAREEFLKCSRDVCPRLVRKDCAQWLEETAPRIPTVVFGAKDPDGRDVDGVSVKMDGASLAPKLDGRAVSVDPGNHVFTFEAPGYAAKDERVLLREREQGRAVSVTLTPLSGRPSPPRPVDRPPPAKGAGPPLLTWILGGAGVGLVGAGAAVYVLGVVQRNDLEKECAPNCTDAQIDPVRTKNVVGVALGAAGVSALVGAAVVWLVAPGSSDGAQAGLWLGPGSLHVGGRF